MTDEAKRELEQTIFEESHNLDFQFVPWSNDKVLRVVIEHVEKLHDEIDADFLQAERDAAFVKGLERAIEIAWEHSCKTYAECCDCRGEIIHAIQAEIDKAK